MRQVALMQQGNGLANASVTVVFGRSPCSLRDKV